MRSPRFRRCINVRKRMKERGECACWHGQLVRHRMQYAIGSGSVVSGGGYAWIFSVSILAKRIIFLWGALLWLSLYELRLFCFVFSTIHSISFSILWVLSRSVTKEMWVARCWWLNRLWVYTYFSQHFRCRLIKFLATCCTMSVHTKEMWMFYLSLVVSRVTKSYTASSHFIVKKAVD